MGRAPAGDTAVRTVMALTDTCAVRAVDRESAALAIGVLREVVDGVRAAGDVQVEDAVCRALSTLAHLSGRHVTSGRAGVEEVAALWRELGTRCRGSADPGLRGWRAQGLGNEALLRLQLGDEEPARRLLDLIAAEFAADPPGASEDVDLWRVRARHAAGVLDRFHVGEPEFELGHLERQRYWDRRRRSTPRGFASWLRAGAPRNHLRELVRQAGAVHRRSVGTVRSWLCTGEPFVLLLRNFELTERSGTSTLLAGPDDPADHVQVISLGGGATPALTELAASVPLVLVASTTAGELELDHQDWGQFTAPVRLYLPHETWFDTVSTLITVTAQVVVWAAELTPGLARELELLTAEGRGEDTLVVLDRLDDPMTQAFLPRTGGERLTKDHPALARFPHVVDAAELGSRDLAGCPPLIAVLERLDAAHRVPLDQRLADIGARLDARRT
ncbi:hypothetical protein ACVDFE_28040 [Lentzea chajnantorensis]